MSRMPPKAELPCKYDIGILWKDLPLMWQSIHRKWTDIKRGFYKWADWEWKWVDTNWTWIECAVAGEIVREFGGALPLEQQLPEWLNKEEKRKKIIKLVCKIQGYDVYKSEKEVASGRKVGVRDINIIINAAKSMNINVKSPIVKFIK